MSPGSSDEDIDDVIDEICNDSFAKTPPVSMSLEKCRSSTMERKAPLAKTGLNQNWIKISCRINLENKTGRKAQQFYSEEQERYKEMFLCRQ